MGSGKVVANGGMNLVSSSYTRFIFMASVMESIYGIMRMASSEYDSIIKMENYKEKVGGGMLLEFLAGTVFTWMVRGTGYINFGVSAEYWETMDFIEVTAL
jgi:hypothetical protein